LRDENGFNATYYAEAQGHAHLASILPPAQKITTKQYSEYREQYLRVHEIVDRRKKTKKKGGKKK
jgi:hypothetical protein